MGRDAIQFAAVASREHEDFFQNSLSSQLAGGFAAFRGAERDAFAEFHARCSVI
jgi:hypothetical protein